MRLIGIRATKPLPCLVSALAIGVSMAPGQTTLTRMPNSPSSCAIERVTPRRPHFEAEYAAKFA